MSQDLVYKATDLNYEMINKTNKNIFWGGLAIGGILTVKYYHGFLPKLHSGN